MRILTARSRLSLRRVAAIFAVFICAALALWTHSRATAQTELAEINADDWRLEAFFLDKEETAAIPQTSVTWDLGEVDRLDEFNHVYTLQVNYHNSSTDKGYAPGELEIRVPNPFSFDYRNGSSLYIQNVMIGADPTGVSDDEAQYDWTYNNESYEDDNQFIFRNRISLEEQTNFEGSIQITFNLRSTQVQQPVLFEERFASTYTSPDVAATLNDVASSNTVKFSFSRISVYDWKYSRATIMLKPEKVVSITGFGDDADNYTWIKWSYLIQDGHTGARLDQEYASDYIGFKNFKIKSEMFANDVKILSRDGNTHATRNNDGTVTIETESGNFREHFFIAGYPKDTYNDHGGINSVTEDIVLYTVYADAEDDDWYEMSRYERTVYISDYYFDYNGVIVGIDKKFKLTSYRDQSDISASSLFAQHIRNKTAYFDSTIDVAAIENSGEEYSLIIGDDVLFYRDDNDGGKTKQVQDSWHYFPIIRNAVLVDQNGRNIDCSTYSVKLYVRKNNATEYTEATRQPRNCYYSDFALFPYEGNVRGWYLRFDGLTQPVKSTNILSSVGVVIPGAADYGAVHNFARVQLIKNGEVMNKVGIESYTSERTRDDIAAYDLATYGDYQQRSEASVEWAPYEMETIYRNYYSSIYSSTPEYIPEKDGFYGTANLGGYVGDYTNIRYLSDWSLVADQFNSNTLHDKYTYHAIMPKGVVVDSTPEEIIASFRGQTSETYKDIKGPDGKPLFSSDAAYKAYIKEHSSVEIIPNWRNSGQYKVTYTIDFSEKPFTSFDSLVYGIEKKRGILRAELKYHIDYDTYRELGLNYTFVSGVEDDLEDKNMPYIVQRDKYFDKIDEYNNKSGFEDINDNGRTDDYMVFNNSTITLLPTMSTKQDILTQVKSDEEADFDAEDSKVNYGKEYDYKLRLRNSSTNRITNAVIYTNIEEAYGDNSHWKGDFLGVDTSFAEAQKDENGNPLTIKVFWSPNTDATSLSNPDDTWQEYDDATTDKSLVKSLAFQILDRNGAPAVLPQANYSYVIVKMLAPDDESISTYAYNQSFSEWNPIDNLNGEIIHQISGIESNIVRVYFKKDIEASAKVSWSEDCDSTKRPSEMTFRLMNGDTLVEEKTINIAEGENITTFTGLDIDEYDNYRIETDEIESYALTKNASQNELSFEFVFTSTMTCDPDDPDEPETPETPEEPEEPSDPEEPETPETPETPEEPEEPSDPEEPETPKNLEQPDLPNTFDGISGSLIAFTLFNIAIFVTAKVAKNRR